MLIPITTILAYLSAAGLQLFFYNKTDGYNKYWLMIIVVFALCLHGYLLHQWIDSELGQNLDFLNLLSLAIWVITILILIIAIIKPIELLTILILPAAAISISLIMIFPDSYVIDTIRNLPMLFHILLSLLTFSVLCVAGLLAILLTLQERLLRYKVNLNLLRKLPSLESIEHLMFQEIALGFILLSILLITSIYFYQLQLIQKTLLVLISWFIFMVLLMGRYLRGWRGPKAIYTTLFGILFLFITYFGGKLLSIN